MATALACQCWGDGQGVPVLTVAYTLEQCWHRVPGGTAVAAVEVARALSGRPDLTLVGVAARHADEPAPPFQPPVEVRHLSLPRPLLYESWHALRWPRVERVTGPVDVVHATSIVVPPRSAPLVVTVHDLAFVHDPSHFTRRGLRFFNRGLALAKRSADVVLCSSKATMDDCAEAGIAPDRLRLVPLGVDVRPAGDRAVEAARRRFGLDRPYLAFTGTIEPRKNLPRLLAAFSQLSGDHLLALIGPDGWGADGNELTAAAGLAANRVRPLGFVAEADKAALLAGADALVYPSLWEGFGLPVLEAMAQGTPVVTSRGVSTEEVAGGAAVLVDPRNPDDIARGISEALAAHEVLATQGRARAATMTWTRTADLTLAAYRELAG